MNTVPTLVETLKDPDKRAAVVSDGVALIESEMRAKSGFRGGLLKAGFRAVKAVHPGVISKALNKLLPAFAPAIDPHYANARNSGDVSAHFNANSSAIAEDMLKVTDERLKKADNPVIIRVYSGLRGQAKGHVETAMPGLARLIQAHVP